jgi:hypothetical protein
VAQVLTYVMQLQAFRGGRRKAAPALPTDFSLPAETTIPTSEPAGASPAAAA